MYVCSAISRTTVPHGTLSLYTPWGAYPRPDPCPLFKSILQTPWEPRALPSTVDYSPREDSCLKAFVCLLAVRAEEQTGEEAVDMSEEAEGCEAAAALRAQDEVALA